MKYQSDDKIVQGALDQLSTDQVDGGDLSSELLAARALLAGAIREGRSGRADAIATLSVLQRLCKEYDRQQIRESEMMSRRVVMEIGRQFAKIAFEIFGQEIGFEEKFGRFIERLEQTVASAKNSMPDQRQLLRLTDLRSGDSNFGA
jgi:hypothetical protein